MAKDITLLGATYTGVPAVTLPTSGGGTATFYDEVGSLPVTANGTYSVNGYASVDVSLTFSTVYTGSSVPSSSLGNDGDIYLQT